MVTGLGVAVRDQEERERRRKKMESKEIRPGARGQGRERHHDASSSDPRRDSNSKELGNTAGKQPVYCRKIV